MPECLGCGTHLSRRLCRVLGDNEHRVHQCPECSEVQGVARGKRLENAEGTAPLPQSSYRSVDEFALAAEEDGRDVFDDLEIDLDEVGKLQLHAALKRGGNRSMKSDTES